MKREVPCRGRSVPTASSFFSVVMKRSLPSSADEGGDDERATKRPRTEPQAEEEEEERDLTKGLIDDVIVEIGRSLVYDSVDAMKIILLAIAPGDYNADIYSLRADLIHYPVARLLSMCNKRGRDIIGRGLPILVPLDGYVDAKKEIRMAWYAWFAGARPFKENMFMTRPGSYDDSVMLHELILAPSSDGTYETLFGGWIKSTHWRSETKGVPRVLTAAAMHFGHEENTRFFYDHYARHAQRTNRERFSAAYVLSHRYNDGDALNSALLECMYARVAFARSREDIEFLAAFRISLSYVPSAVSAICMNGQPDVMDFAWTCLIGKDTHFPSSMGWTAWTTLFHSPVGSYSRAAHDWLHARLPFPLSREVNGKISHYTATSDRWLRDQGLDKRSTCFEFRPYTHRDAFAYALANGDLVALNHVSLPTWVCVSAGQLTLAELKRYASLAVDHPGMQEWLIEASHAIRSTDAIRTIVAMITDPNRMLFFARHYLSTPRHADVIRLFFDRIMDVAITRADGIAALEEIVKTTAAHTDFASIRVGVDYICRRLAEDTRS